MNGARTRGALGERICAATGHQPRQDAERGRGLRKTSH
jgi:hypothetical protein